MCILSKGVAGQRHAGIVFGDLDADGLRFRSAYLGRTQHGVLGEQLSVNLGDQEVVAALITAPYLAGLDRFDHELRLLRGESARQSGNLPLNKLSKPAAGQRTPT